MCAGCSSRHRKPRGICAKAGVSFTLAVPTASACHSSAVRSMRLRRERSRDSRRDLPETSAPAASPLTTSNPARLILTWIRQTATSRRRWFPSQRFIGLAKTAKLVGVPTILTTVVEERGGFLIKGLQDVFPEQKPINRTFINTWEDNRVVDAVKKTGRKKVIMAALWTEICLAMPTIHALGEGYEVYIVTDASGGVTSEAHEMAVRRMVQAGGGPETWMAGQGELQRDWARESTAAGLAEILAQHGGGSGVAFAWEMQLLAGNDRRLEGQRVRTN